MKSKKSKYSFVKENLDNIVHVVNLKEGDSFKYLTEPYDSLDEKTVLDSPTFYVNRINCDFGCNLQKTYRVTIFASSGKDAVVFTEPPTKLVLRVTEGLPMHRDNNIKKTVENDAVNHPSHYTQGKIEVIDFINDQKMNYNLGNALKYICRCNYKGKKIEDLKKAIWYINKEIEIEETNNKIVDK